MSDTLKSQDSRDGKLSSKPGAHSSVEILSQPACWEICLAELSENQVVTDVVTRFGSMPDWLFVGCGSSYYVALVAAATMKLISGRTARAVPASEILLYPDLVFSNECVPILISRSGQTSEILKAAEILKERMVPSIAVTCTRGQLLEDLATMTMVVPADEKSTVMTRSFTSMLLVLQFLAGRIAGRHDFCEALFAMPESFATAITPLQEQISNFVSQRQLFESYVALGHGPFYGLACEYALKIMEMSVSYAQFFHPLEFRHGPKSIVAPETLVIFLLSEQGYGVECDLLEELKSLGGTTMVVANRASSRVRDLADLLLELSLDFPELARLAPSLVAGQLLGLYTGLKKGLNPDSPRHLSRSVILNQPDAVGPEHAAL